MTTLKDLEVGDTFIWNNNSKTYKVIERCEKPFYVKGLNESRVPIWFYYPDDNVQIIKKDKKDEEIKNIKKIEKTEKPLRLYLGCFNKPIHGWTNVDIRPYPETKADVVDDILKLEKFEDNSIDEILSVHTLEHVGRYEYKDALKVWFNKLKIGGKLWLSVPDIEACCEHYVYHKDLEFLLSFFVGSQKHKYDFHYMCFDQKILTKALEEVGFKNVERYDWTKTDFAYVDNYQGAYAKHLDRSSRLLSLNVTATK